jgi:hypothetical protein
MARWLLIVLLLAGCAGQPGPPAARPAALGEWRARVVNAALAEWRAWGQLTVDGWPEALGREPDPANFSRIQQYWAAVEEGAVVNRRHQETYDAMMLAMSDSSAEGFAVAPPAPPAISIWAHPAWSAAFVSHVMQSAGVPGFVFPPRASHAAYIDALLAQATESPSTAGFLPHDPAEYAPRPGDLVCADRSRVPLIQWQERLAEFGEFRPMHCDIVVADGGRLVQAIGGNVLDATVLRRFPADAAGRLLPAPWDKPRFLLVLENRM